MNTIKSALLITLALSLQQSISQTSSYQFAKETTLSKLDPYYKRFYYVYSAKHIEIEFPIYDTIEKPSEKYKALRNNLAKVQRDSTNYVTQINKHKKINSICEYISVYLNSKSSFKFKKYHLIEAQKIANEYNIDKLIYADKTFNEENRKSFNSIKGKLDDYLIGISYEISTQFPIEEDDKIFKHLKGIRYQLKTTNKTTKQIIETGTEKRRILITGDRIKDFENISGLYDNIGEFHVLDANINGFVKGQLINKDSIINKSEIKSTRIYGPIYPVLKNRETNEYFYTDYDFLREFGVNNVMREYVELLKRNGFPSRFDGDILYIKTSKGEVRATYDIYEQVKKNNFNYINEISRSIIRFKQLVKQSKPLIDKLASHYNAHKNFTMTTSRLTTWKNDAKKGQEILNQIKSLKGNEEEISDYFLRKIDNTTAEIYIEFLEVLNGTKVVLGM
ncbi:hypothetical protein [Seonamhaeicola marinus]|uniref:Uncharacterized protein n=1 Tax=Seonamhaeicola marinus TaxID=1912246 RepID=A0A5D0I4C7_9FLAO|nr:hypothetical protein [Seonamhaeicola marinus]TYA78536.1 hypothetical protein FUA24_09275 [Seonamhaeicola marinus]